MSEPIRPSKNDILTPEIMATLLEAGKTLDIQGFHASLVKFYTDLGLPEEMIPTVGNLQFRRELSNETDRGAALYAAAHLDGLLEMCLRGFLVDDPQVADSTFNGTAALASFSARIDMAYLTGLVSATVRRELHIIRKIRNDFAHSSRALHFADEPIASRCRELTRATLAKSPRSRYIHSVMSVGGILDATLLSLRLDSSRRCLPSPEVAPRKAELVEMTMALYANSLQEIPIPTKEPS